MTYRSLRKKARRRARGTSSWSDAHMDVTTTAVFVSDMMSCGASRRFAFLRCMNDNTIAGSDAPGNAGPRRQRGVNSHSTAAHRPAWADCTPSHWACRRQAAGGTLPRAGRRARMRPVHTASAASRDPAHSQDWPHRGKPDRSWCTPDSSTRMTMGAIVAAALNHYALGPEETRRFLGPHT